MKYRSRVVKEFYQYKGDVKGLLDFFKDEIDSYRVFNNNTNVEIWAKGNSNSKTVREGLYVSYNGYSFDAWDESVMKDWEIIG